MQHIQDGKRAHRQLGCTQLQGEDGETEELQVLYDKLYSCQKRFSRREPELSKVFSQ
jgi:hypothetical protein